MNEGVTNVQEGQKPAAPPMPPTLRNDGDLAVIVGLAVIAYAFAVIGYGLFAGNTGQASTAAQCPDEAVERGGARAQQVSAFEGSWQRSVCIRVAT